jgi:cytidylate kinase
MTYSVIAIEREYASGGLEIGSKLAEKLGIPCYGQEILAEAAVKLNMPVEHLRRAEENITGSFLYGIAAFSSIMSGNNADLLSLEQRLALAEAEVIKNLAYKPCIIVGRGACVLLKDNVHTLNVFIHADKNTRISRAVNTYGIDAKQAESFLQHQDKRRSTYFKVTTNMEWKDADLYHLIINSGKTGIDRAVDIIYEAYSAK